MIPKVRKFRKRSSRQSIFFLTLIGFLVLGIIGFLVISDLRINQRKAGLETKIEKLKKEIQALEKKNQGLKAGIAQSTQEDYWKEKLYEQGYVEEGEQQVVILPPEEEAKEEKNFLNPKNWLEWIKNKLVE